jgi:hypothetical protein
MDSDLTFLERSHKNPDAFLNHIVQVTGGEIRVSFMNVDTKNQSKSSGCTHGHQTSRKTLNKRCLPES